ncbi:toxin [Salmonella enterica]|nr:toxin [Salmonella enterica]
MKKNSVITIVFFFLFSILSGCSSSEESEQPGASNANSDSITPENGSLFSLRNIQSGFMIPSVLNQEGREISGWRLIQQPTPAEALVHSPSGWVQFNDPLTERCMIAASGLNLVKGACNTRESLFILIPSTTGAVQIKSVVSGKCILDQEDGDVFKFGECIADIQKPQLIVPERNLWMLNPPVTVSSIAPVKL